MRESDSVALYRAEKARRGIVLPQREARAEPRRERYTGGKRCGKDRPDIVIIASRLRGVSPQITKRRRPPKYPWHQMLAGDWFIVTFPAELRKKIKSQLPSLARQWSKQYAPHARFRCIEHKDLTATIARLA